MTPNEFIAKWRDAGDERAAAQPHFIDLCRLLGQPDPQTADPGRAWFCFERGASRTGGGAGWADVWRRGCFGWEYKSRGRNLEEAHKQLLTYSGALENPPLLIVCDFARYSIRTNWTNTVQERHDFRHEDLADAAVRDRLLWAFADPERLKPAKTRAQLTEEAAGRFAGLAARLRARGHAPQAVAHFVNRLVFCMFAEDIGLLPNKLFQRAMERSETQPDKAEAYLRGLFAAMRAGGEFGLDDIPWFNGGLFDDAEAFPLMRDDVADVLASARLYWGDIDPAILGTLFERGLDPDKRSQLGAHYTDREKIMLIVEPVVIRPLLAEWEATKAQIAAALPAAKAAQGEGKKAQAARAEPLRLRDAFIDRPARFRVLDPACGSGNFLYLALLALKDIEHRANLEAEALGLPRGFPRVGPECVLGIELNLFAAELARVSVWIGDIQWMRRNGFEAARNPILRPLDTIECRDAVLNPDETRAAWPKADVVVGNPPFLGDRRMIAVMGEDYVTRLWAAYAEQIPGRSDLVCYWFAQVAERLASGNPARAGLVATNSISGGNNPLRSKWSRSMVKSGKRGGMNRG